jgi:hypothetical protein
MGQSLAVASGCCAELFWIAAQYRTGLGNRWYPWSWVAPVVSTWAAQRQEAI